MLSETKSLKELLADFTMPGAPDLRLPEVEH